MHKTVSSPLIYYRKYCHGKNSIWKNHTNVVDEKETYLHFILFCMPNIPITFRTCSKFLRINPMKPFQSQNFNFFDYLNPFYIFYVWNNFSVFGFYNKCLLRASVSLPKIFIQALTFFTIQKFYVVLERTIFFKDLFAYFYLFWNKVRGVISITPKQEQTTVWFCDVNWVSLLLK